MLTRIEAFYCVPPHLAQQFVAGQWNPCVFHEVAQKLKLPTKKQHGFAFSGNLPRGECRCGLCQNDERPPFEGAAVAPLPRLRCRGRPFPMFDC